MKRTLALIALVLALASAASATNISLKLTGGVACLAGGDYNAGIEGYNAYIAAYGHNVAGAFSELQLGMDFEAELILGLTENLGVGIGAGYMRFSLSRETVDYDWDLLGLTFHSTDFLAPNIYAIPLALNVHYDLPVGELRVGLFAGVGYYLFKMRVESGFDSDFLGIGSDVVFESNKAGGRFGFQGGLSAEVPLGRDFAFVVDLVGRFVSLKDIRGDYTRSGTFLGIPYTYSGNDAYFYTEELKYEGVFYRMNDWITDAEAPTSSIYRNVRRGTFGLGGISGQAGIKVRF
jgi:opacity protein-like surface antigen